MQPRKPSEERVLVSQPTNEPYDLSITEPVDEHGADREKFLSAKAPGDKPAVTADISGPQYLEGLPLLLVVGSVTLVCFLVLLDTSIIATVRNNKHTFERRARPLLMPCDLSGHSPDHRPISLPT
jgi:hypothetical protein